METRPQCFVIVIQVLVKSEILVLQRHGLTTGNSTLIALATQLHGLLTSRNS